MSFQGFTREERFSDNQIRIDINSVISNDLAEANRQSKYLGRNADLERQWGSMYLNAMVNKHENEQRNREENFEFFMENREAIQKQVEYNNEIRYKDAGQNKHVKSLGEILGEGVLKLAVAAGSVAIKEIVKDHKARQAEKKDEDQKQTRAHAERYEAEASPDQKRLTDEGFFEKYAEATAEGKIYLREYYNSQGKHQLGDINVAHHNKMMGMDTIERLDARFSENNIAKGYLETLQNFEGEYNGRTVTFESLYAHLRSSIEDFPLAFKIPQEILSLPISPEINQDSLFSVAKTLRSYESSKVLI